MRFHPTTEGAKSGNLSLNTNEEDPQNPPQTVSVPIALSGNGVKPTFVQDRLAIAYGPRRVGTHPVETVKISNMGALPLVVAAPSLPQGSAFTISPDTAFTLASGQEHTINVTFHPTAEVPSSADLSFSTNDPSKPSPKVTLTGSGVKSTADVSTYTLAFGPQRRGTVSTALTVRVENKGSAPLSAGPLSISQGAPFVLAPNAPSAGFTLPVGQAADLAVMFSPTSTGPFTGSLSFTTDDPDEPTVTVNLTGTGVKPTVVPSTSILAFGEQRVNTVSTAMPVVVENTGDETLVVSQPSLPANAPFAVSPNAAFNVLPGQQTTLMVTFRPIAESTATPNLTLTTNDPDEPTVTIALSGRGVKPIVELSQPSVAFGPQRVGTTSAISKVAVRNTGTGTLKVTALNLPQGAPFTVSPPAPFDVPQGSEQELSLTFAPAALGSVNANLFIVTNDTDNSPSQLLLSGTGVRPNVQLLPGALGFGDQRVGFPSTARMVTVENTGDGPVEIKTVVTSNGAFTVTPAGPFILGPQDSESLSVVFNPSATGALTATLGITTDDASQTVQPVTLTGNGVKPLLQLLPAPSISFGEQRVNVAADRPLKVRNTGTGPITITGVSLPAGRFTVVAPSTPFTLLAQGEEELTVTFLPTTEVASTANLTLTTDEPTASSVVVALSGNGVKPILALSAATVSFGAQRVGTPSPVTKVNVQNSGNTGTLRVTQLSLPQGVPFTVTPNTPFDLLPGAQQELSLTFNPNTEGSFSASLSLANNTSTAPATVELSEPG